MKLTDVTPQRKNANKHTPRGMGALERSIQKDGWIGAITVAADGETFDGSARVEVGAQTGFEDAIVVESDGTRPVIVRRKDIPTADDPRAVRLGVAANRVAQLDLEWDTDVLADLQSQGDVLEGLFTSDELDTLLADLNKPEGAGGDDFDTTPQDGPTRVQRGEVWQVGVHRVMCGDSTDAGDVGRLLDGAKPSMIWADPPYGMNLDTDYDGMFSGDKQHRKTGARFKPVEGDNKDYDPAFLMAYFAGVAEQVWWGADYYANKIPNLTSGTFVVWDKRCSSEMDKVVGNVYELAWSKRARRKEIIRLLWSGHHGMQGDTKKRVHPTQKPVALVTWFFERGGKKDNVIFDPYLGSGSSVIAAHRTGRVCYGMEIEPRYCDVILRRAEAEGIGPVERLS